MENGQKAGK